MRRLVSGLFIACLGYSADMQRFVSDPLYVNQWHLAPYGIHINIGNTWDFVTGRGINIGIVDDGLDLTHEDLAPNVYPKVVSSAGTHGTQCAGLAAAAGFNDIGMIGVAPEARLVGQQPEDAFMHVSIVCAARLHDGKDPGRIGPFQQTAMEEAAANGRDGLGTVLVVPAGDGRALGDDSGYDAFASSRFAIAVGAVTRDGQQGSYSESGMNLAISAPGGEPLAPASLWTTAAGGSYTEEFYGTAAATSIVGGAVALLLERNAALGYRDIKEILMRSATRESLSGEPFEVNGGGIAFSHSFGAGLLDVSAAVALADQWIPLGPIVTIQTRNHAVMAIADDPLNPLQRYLDLYGGQPVRVEHVELTVTVRHARRGDLSFTVVSPSGMKSIAAPRPNDDGADFESYTFTSVRHWGEMSTGMWKVIVTDHNGNGISGEMLEIQLRLFGTIPRG